MNNTPKPQTGGPDMDWKAECQCIAYQAGLALAGRTSATFNSDPSCLFRYAKMQRDTAIRQAQHKVAAYIQHYIDKLSIYG